LRVLELDDPGVVAVAVAAADVGLRCVGELRPVGVVAALDDELDERPEVALDAVEVAGVGRRGQQPDVVVVRPSADVRGPVGGEAVHHDVDGHLDGVAATDVAEELEHDGAVH
jgi:hypothetical protein